MTHEPILDVAIDAEDMATRATLWLATRIALAKGPFALSLAGGSTPKRVYELLAGPAFKDYVDWPQLHLFWGDERCVPYDHPDSNYRMVDEALIRHVPIPPENVHKIPVEAGSPEQAAALYEEELKRYYGASTLDPNRPLFDVTLLGLGSDGHTASLFPTTDVLEERTRWSVPVVGVKSEARISLTYPVLESSAAIVFLAVGQEKRQPLAGVLARDMSLPAARIEATAPILWFTDRAAYDAPEAAPAARTA